MKKVWVLAIVLTSVTALTLNAQDVKKEQVKKDVKTEQTCKEKKDCSKQDSSKVAVDKEKANTDPVKDKQKK